MRSTIEQVREFHKAFRVNTRKNIKKRRAASFRLMLEELLEFYDAQTDVERLDALLDLQYFLDGTMIAYGFDKSKDAAFAEVHASNMSKLGSNGKPIYRPDGKVLKGPNYRPPDLKKFV